MPRKFLVCSIVVVGSAALLTSCPNDVEFVDALVLPPGCTVQPTFELLSPNPAIVQPIQGDMLPLTIDVGGFTIVDKPNQPDEDCEGHFHLFIDGVFRQFVTDTDTDVDIGDLAGGVHELRLEVRTNLHAVIPEVAPLTATFDRDLN